MNLRSSAMLSCALAIAGMSTLGSASDPQVRILSPGDGVFVTGLTTLRAGVEPPGQASSVVFFVDGRQVCTRMKPP
ncbi:MAG: Ig-like domain-containing protein, partial [Vicinamibacterales bacterium]